MNQRQVPTLTVNEWPTMTGNEEREARKTPPRRPRPSTWDLRLGVSRYTYPVADMGTTGGGAAGFEEYPQCPPGVTAVTVPIDDPAIHRTAEPWPSLEALPVIERAKYAYKLLKTMRENGGIGLAAPQIGDALRVLVISTNTPIVAFNPRIVDFGQETDRLGEGCLSFPELTVKVERSKKIRVRYEDITGEVKSKTLEGLAARVFQHELDHLDGVTFFEKTHPLHRDKARNQWARIKRQRQKK